MKKFILMLGLAGSLLVSGGAFADNLWHTSKIKRIYPLYSGSVIFYLEDSHPECKNGAGNAKTTFYLTLNKGPRSVTEVGFKHIYSAALTAFTTGKTVSIYFDSSTGGCYIDRILVTK